MSNTGSLCGGNDHHPGCDCFDGADSPATASPSAAAIRATESIVRETHVWLDISSAAALIDHEMNPLVSALRAFVDYYDQAGIGPCPEEETDDCPAMDTDEYSEQFPGFDGDEQFNVHHGRAALRRHTGETE